MDNQEKGTWEMKKQCKFCGELLEEDDWNICESCREKAKTFDNALEIGNSWREEVSINGLWKHCFSQQDIDDILYARFNSLSKEEQQKMISEYCEDDMLYFVNWLVRKCR